MTHPSLLFTGYTVDSLTGTTCSRVSAGRPAPMICCLLEEPLTIQAWQTFSLQDPNADTEWNDVLRSKGIIPQKENEVSEDDIVQMLESTIQQKVQGTSLFESAYTGKPEYIATRLLLLRNLRSCIIFVCAVQQNLSSKAILLAIKIQSVKMGGV